MSGWLHSLCFSRTHAAAIAATGHGPGWVPCRTHAWRDESTHVPNGGPPPCRGRFERREQRGHCSRPRRSCLFGSPSCPAGPGTPTPLAPPSPPCCRLSARHEFPHRLPPHGESALARSGESAVPDRQRQAVRVRRFPVPLRRNGRDDAGQARCPVHRACCLFMPPASRAHRPVLSPSSLAVAPAPGSAARAPHFVPTCTLCLGGAWRDRYAFCSLLSFGVQ